MKNIKIMTTIVAAVVILAIPQDVSAKDITVKAEAQYVSGYKKDIVRFDIKKDFSDKAIIYRKDSSESSFSKIAETKDYITFDKETEPNSDYDYKVVIYNKAGKKIKTKNLVIATAPMCNASHVTIKRVRVDEAHTNFMITADESDYDGLAIRKELGEGSKIAVYLKDGQIAYATANEDHYYLTPYNEYKGKKRLAPAYRNYAIYLEPYFLKVKSTLKVDADEKYKDAVEALDADWERASKIEREQLLQRYFKECVRVQGAGENCTMGFADLSEGCLGFSYWDIPFIQIRKSYLESTKPESVMITIAHEVRHQYQCRRTKIGESDYDIKMQAAMESYTQPEDDYQAYYNNPMEVDARDMGNAAYLYYASLGITTRVE